jgi:hypothetical protein
MKFNTMNVRSVDRMFMSKKDARYFALASPPFRLEQHYIKKVSLVKAQLH